MPYSGSLTKIIDKLTEHGANVRQDAFSITIKIDITKKETNIEKLRSYTYFLLNKFVNQYFVHIDGIPYCLMPDASRYMTYTKKDGVSYKKMEGCKKCKFCNTCPGWENNHKLDVLPPPVNDVPSEIVLEITKKCNLRCTVCWSAHSNKEIPLARIKAVIDECADQGIKIVRFSGGEPLLHKDAPEALYYAKSKKLHVILNTNATVLTKKIEKAIVHCVDNCLVSLQGFDAASEKFLTKSPMNFRKKMRNLVVLNSRLNTFRLGTIISKTLINNFEKYHYLIRKLGVKSWELYRPMLLDDAGEFDITREDILWLMERVKEIKLGGFDCKIASPVPFCVSEDLNLSKYVLLGATAADGHSRIVYDVDGFFKPSYYMSQNLGEKVIDSWQNPFLLKIRSLDYLPQKCRDCFYLKWCKGGSRQLAKVASDDYLNYDPLMNRTQEYCISETI